MIIKIDKHLHDFVVLDKTCFNDITLSWRATGLHSYLMGLPHDWKVNVKDLVNRKIDGRTGVQSAIDELESKGYVQKHRLRGEKGRMAGWEYTIYEIPQKIERSTVIGQTVIGESTPTKDTKSTKDTCCNILKKNITSDSSNSTENNLKSNQTPKDPPIPPPPPDPNFGWSGRVMTMWKEKTGGYVEGYKLKIIKPIVLEHGIDVVLVALEKYIDATLVDYLSLAKFAETFGRWHHARAAWLDNPERFASPSRQ